MNQGDSTTPEEQNQEEIGFVTPPKTTGEDTQSEEGLNEDNRSIVSVDNEPSRKHVVTPHLADETPELDKAIADIKEFEYNFDPQDAQTPEKGRKEPTAPAPQAFMMFSPQTVAPLPTLKTEPWPHVGEKPTPITIGKARRYLASAYEAIDCAALEAGIHGHAWMIETEDTWNEREDTGTVPIPTKVQNYIGADMTLALQNAHEKEIYRLYHHLVQEGRDTLIGWFGKAMFHDMPSSHGILKASTTPRQMLDHIAATYGKARDHRLCMETVEKAFNVPYSAKTGIETYFMNLEEAADDAKSLGREYTDQQKIDKALGNFERVHGKDANKAEDRWEESKDHSWTAFMVHWKDAIHKIEPRSKKTHAANQVVQEQVEALAAQMKTMQLNMNTMEEENRSIVQENIALNATQVQFHRALQVEHERRGGSSGSDRNSSSDDISALTEAISRASSIEQRLNAKLDQMNQRLNTDGTRSTDNTTREDRDGSAGPTTSDLVHAMKNLPANTYAYMNGGKGLQFRKYCRHCGCNCSHWTRSCPYINEDEKRRYKKANFRNTMGGSNHNMDRRDKWQSDFNFDSY